MTAPTPVDIFTPSVARARVEDLDAQISDLGNSLSELKTERQSFHAQFDAFVYPVLTLPNEITPEIFFRRGDTFVTWISAPTFPLFLGHICRKWREIALTTSSLWTEVALSVGAVAAQEHQLRLLETWLNCSRDCLLDPLAAGVENSIHEVIDSILSHRRRCRILSLVIPLCDIPLIDDEFPLLRIASIGSSDLPENTQQADHAWPMKLFHQAPQLRVIITSSWFSPNILLLPWAQIRTLLSTSDWGPFPHIISQILPSAANLQCLRLKIDAASDDEIMANVPVLPPLMQLFTLDFTRSSDPKGCMQLLEKLMLPALRNFCLPEPCLTPIPVVVIQNLLARSGCYLSSLHILIVDVELSWVHYTRALLSVGSIVVQGSQSDDNTS
ncbi:hypothetical protein DFH09DRAFT_1092609 [Mycena vulgaris]|nr:hypothetical protein DFH09DRAFT_1092609 [Mycena vulgaris]